MINIINTASDAMITGGTVSDIGLCYYDYETESLLELSSLDINECSISPMLPIIKKYYLIANTDPLSYITVRLDADNDVQLDIGAKIIISEVKPVIADFDNLTYYNEATVSNPVQNHLIPVWILLQPITSTNNKLSINISLEAN